MPMNTKLKDDRWCFACGSLNPHGLHLSDLHLEGEECVCTFTPDKWHQGWEGILHGGITATLLDEVMTHALWRRGYDAVTAELTVRLKLPIPLGERLTVRARIEDRRRSYARVAAALTLPGGETAATGSAKFVATERGPDAPGGRLSLAARDAVIFDLFGTLVPVFDRDEYFGVLGEMAQALGMDEAAFIAGFRGDQEGRTTGRWESIEANLRDIARRAGHEPTAEAVTRASRIRIDYTRRSLMDPYPDALVALAALQAAGRPVGLISDCSPEVPLLWPLSPLAQTIPAPVLSCAVGLRKPDPGIYALACERLGAPAARTVYVGDGDSDELSGAAAAGLCPILIDRGETSAFRLRPQRDGCDIIVHDLTQVLPLIGLGEVPGDP